MISQVQAKLNAWKARQLSFVGRVTLSEAVVEALPIYQMMATMTPKSCVQEFSHLHISFMRGR